MPTIAKTSSQIATGNWVTIQQRLTSTNSFNDTLPSDDVGGGGTGPFLVFENGIWKYPEQDSGGRFVIPDMRRPYELANLTFSLGSSVAWTLNIKGNPSNTTDTPYPSADAADYLEGDFQIDGATAQIGSINYSVFVAAKNVIIYPGQYVWFGTAAITGASVVRMLFKPLYDGKG